jgi:hypothetical protein
MSSRLLEFKPVPMVVSLRGVKAAARRYRGGLRASLDSSTLKDAAVRDTCESGHRAIGWATCTRARSKPKPQKIPRALDRRSRRLPGAMEQGTGLRADSQPNFAAPQEYPRCFASEE